MLKAVIFDVDGTLCDTTPLCIEALRQAAEPYCGRHLSDDDILATFGPSEEGAVQLLCPEHADEILEACVLNYRKLHGNFVSGLFDGLDELLKWLKAAGLKLGIVTGKGPRTLEIELELQGIADLFDCVQHGMPYGPSKPWGIAQVLEHLDVLPEEALYIGDMASDIRSSRKAGVRAVSAAWSKSCSPVEELLANQPDFLAHSVGEFRAYLEDVLKKENQ